MMDFEQPCQRFYTFMRHKLGDTAKQIFEDLHAVTGDSCAGKSTVYRWIKEFSDEKTSSTPSASRGPPISVRSEQTIASVKAHVEEDPHSTVRELSNTCGLSIGTVHKILHEDLHMKKLAARWVPHLLTDEQKNGGLIVHAIYLNLLSRMDQNGCMMWSPGMKLGSHFMAFPTNVATVRGWVLAETDQLFYDQVFRAESDYLPFFSTAVDLWHLTFFLRRQRSLPSTTLKWFSRKLKIPSVSNAQRSKPRKRCFSTTMRPPTKPSSPRPT